MPSAVIKFYWSLKYFFEYRLLSLEDEIVGVNFMKVCVRLSAEACDYSSLSTATVTGRPRITDAIINISGRTWPSPSVLRSSVRLLILARSWIDGRLWQTGRGCLAYTFYS
jgi:hypothetical protein